MNARIAMVVTESMVARILAHKLSREGHVVTWLRDMSDSCPACEVVIVDLGHGAQSESAAALASRWVGSHPWLALTEAAQPEAGHWAVENGAAGVIATPFKPTRVAEQVRVLLTLVAS